MNVLKKAVICAIINNTILYLQEVSKMNREFFDSNDEISKNAEEKKKAEQRKKTFNGLCASEWAELSKSVWNDVSSVRQKKHLKHGATFPEKLCKRLI